VIFSCAPCCHGSRAEIPAAISEQHQRRSCTACTTITRGVFCSANAGCLKPRHSACRGSCSHSRPTRPRSRKPVSSGAVYSSDGQCLAKLLHGLDPAANRRWRAEMDAFLGLGPHLNRCRRVQTKVDRIEITMTAARSRRDIEPEGKPANSSKIVSPERLSESESRTIQVPTLQFEPTHSARQPHACDLK